MRTQEEILKRIEEVKNQDFFGTERNDLVDYLTYENAKQFLKEGVTKDEWNKDKKLNNENILKEMLDYMDFAWGKAIDERGLSASRSLSHYSAWIWLLDDGNFEEFNNQKENNYAMYGKPVLKWICEKYNFPKRSD